MYENMTFESILQQMLGRVPPTMDKREGSIIYDAIAPAAVELQNLYIELDWILEQSFGDTASREFLIKRAMERGLKPNAATNAVLKGEFTPLILKINVGSKFSLGTLNYTITEKITDGTYKLKCDEEGTIGNGLFGELIPIDYIEGLETAHLTELLIPGEDEEETEVFRTRFLNSYNSNSFGGNIADYKEKVNMLDGVGGVKVYPVWNGGGTVKLVIINSGNGVPSSELIESVQTTIDPTQNSGKGFGLAPIGHVVTVIGVSETTVDIHLNITFQTGWDWNAINGYVEDVIDSYFKELAGLWQDSNVLVVRVSQIETRILNLEGVLDVQNTTLNNVQSNLILDANTIPKKGMVSNG